MTTFISRLNQGLTENGAATHSSSLDPIVDFFGLAGAMRNTPDRAVELFEKAFNADPQLAVRTLFYLRDVRGGQGERDVFRACYSWLSSAAPHAVAKTLQHVPEYGRWDDVLHVGAFEEAAGLISEQLSEDLALERQARPVSLLAKWLPSENTSSSETRALAGQLRRRLELSPRDYRKSLSTLRQRIRVLERDMSNSDWDMVDYSKLPSQAHRRHVKAFQRHTPGRYQDYLDSVQRGEAKINTKALYPHEIYQMVQKGETAYANVAWENLPDYTRGDNALVMADVSGSMVQNYNSANPIAVSVSLALYFAERNVGAFKDYFMTFSGQPQLVRVTGNTLQARMSNIANASWQQNTDLLAAFRAIKNAALGSPQDVPKVLYVISDMEFDSATSRRGYSAQTQVVRDPWGRAVYAQVNVPCPTVSSDTVFATAKREFEQAGLRLPHVVFWNVQARQTQTPATILDGSVSLVSGLSPSIFAQAVQGKGPRELVESVVNAERYQRILL